MKNANKTNINCAVTGTLHTLSRSPHLTITAQENAAQSLVAAKAGSSIPHAEVFL